MPWPACSFECRAALSASHVQLKDDGPATRTARMMSEIFHHGPITCSMAASDDFIYNYDGSVWVDKKVRRQAAGLMSLMCMAAELTD